MKRIVIYLSLVAATIVSSCEKVIEVELNEADAQVAIEAPLYAGTHNFTVTITATNSYFEAGLPDGLNGAVVTLMDDLGNTEILTSTGNGQYEALVTAVPGRTYELEVTLGGTTYKATSTLLNKVEIDQLEIEYQEAVGPIPEGYFVFNRFFDPAAEDNFYRVRHWVNDTLQNEGSDLIVYDDVLINGNYTRVPLFQQIFDLNDTVQVEFIHFDQAAFDYFFSLGDIVADQGGGGGGNAAPGNPNTNWDNNALGYFAAMSSDTMTVIVQ